MGQVKQPQLNEPGTAGNDGGAVGKKTRQDPKGRKVHAGANGTGASTAGRPGGAGGR